MTINLDKFKKNIKVSEEAHSLLFDVKRAMKKRNFNDTIIELSNFYFKKINENKNQNENKKYSIKIKEEKKAI